MSKLEKLNSILEGKDNFVLAFSGGLDSTFLAFYLKKLGKNLCAVTVDTGMLHSIAEVKETAKQLGIMHKVIKVDLLNDKTFTENSIERCYICKKEIIRALRKFQEKNGYDFIVDATNRSDLSDYKATMVALIEENILLPLLSANIGKEEIIEHSQKFGLELKSSETCLATRLPLYSPIKKEDIEKIRKFENRARKLGFSLVRAMPYENLLRIEILDSEMEMALKKRKELSNIARKEGFKYVALDLAAHR